MGVMVGRINTEAGIIPEDWTVVPFQEATHLITCGLAATPTYVSESVGKPFLSAQNVRNGQVVFENYKFIGRELFEQITRHNKPRRGDLLYTRVGAGIGEAGIVESDIEFGIYVSLTLIKTNPKKLHNGFAAYLLNSPRYRMLARNGQFAGGGVQNLNVEVVRRFPIPLPSVAEQRAIASTLSDMDALLDGLERLIAKKHDLKQAAMQQLLNGKIRLPGFNGEWKIAIVHSLCEYADGASTSGGDLGYLEIGDIDVFSKTYDVSGKEKPAVRGAIRVPVGTLLISTVRPTRGAIAVTKDEIFVSGAFCRLRPFNDFLFHLVCQDRFLAHLGENSIGGTYPTCRDETILNYKCFVPSDSAEQVAIAAVLSDMDAELSALIARRDKTRALKQAMMQELLTGKTRLV